ncbi:MAG: class I SAM-dependent methyltransferase [Methanotrichaceae archaeon]|nr:class I SAM-dependent methyltransferase [Methanotrichaceae archaeon]
MTLSQNDGTKRWNNNAEQWHRLFGENDLNRRDLLDPLILQVLGNVKGKQILDAGCGDGYLCRKLAKLGASITGAELSQKMLGFAIEEQERAPLTISYYQANCSSLPFLLDSTFDVVLTNNVIQDMDDYQGAFKEFSRLLKSGGTYLHIMNHPCFMTPVWGWIKDDKGEKLYRKVDYYFKRGPFLCPWGPSYGMQPTVYWHRTLGDIINDLISCEFRINKVIEPEPPESWKTEHNDRMDAGRIPDFLVLVCERIAKEKE